MSLSLCHISRSFSRRQGIGTAGLSSRRHIDDDVLQTLVLCVFFKPAAVYLHALDIQKLLQYHFHGAVLLPVFWG